jgi:hypothetical protein
MHFTFIDFSTVTSHTIIHRDKIEIVEIIFNLISETNVKVESEKTLGIT